MRQKADIDEILPCLSCCRGKCSWLPHKKKDLTFALRKAIHKELGIKMPKGESKIENNPFLMLGFGMNAFLEMKLVLMYMFLCITIFLIPVYIIYGFNPDKGMINMDPSVMKY